MIDFQLGINVVLPNNQACLRVATSLYCHERRITTAWDEDCITLVVCQRLAHGQDNKGQGQLIQTFGIKRNSLFRNNPDIL